MIVEMKESPKNGDLRLKRKFAFFPTELTDGRFIWLQRYYDLQMYFNVEYRKWPPVDDPGWKFRSWERFETFSDLKKFLKEQKEEKKKNDDNWIKLLGFIPKIEVE